MPEQAIKLSEIADRLERVEKENQRLKRIGLVLLLALSALVLMGQAGTGRTMEAEKFILRDQAGKMRAELDMDQSGAPGLTFYDKTGERSAEYRNTDVWISTKEGTTWIMGGELSVSNSSGHIDFQANPLRLYIHDDKGVGYVSLGITSALTHEEESGPALTLFGSKGRGFVELNTADGPRLHMEPGMQNGKILPGGFVDISADKPVIQVSDQQGFAAALGRAELEDKQTGKKLHTSAASVVLTGKSGVLWSTP